MSEENESGEEKESIKETEENGKRKEIESKKRGKNNKSEWSKDLIII